jgi:predicted murein hydrolase (TIGR00659 family)
VNWNDFGMALTWFGATVLAYLFARRLAAKKHLRWIPPLIITAAILVLLIESGPFAYEDYEKGGGILTYLLGPATVALAYPLYRYRKLVRENASEIVAATLVSSFASLLSMLLFAHMLGFDRDITVSLLPKCVTTPVALEITKMTDGILGLAVVGVFITGLSGSVFGHALLKLLRVRGDIPQGLAMGAVCHVIGTAKCLETNECQGAMAALVMVLSALWTTFLFFILYL